jgi:hypothetical protein
MSNKKQIKITQEDLAAIYGKDYHVFEEKIIPNCYCHICQTSYRSTIVKYEIFLNDLNDIILEGFCAKCGSRMNRYLETGEVPEYQERIEQIKQLEKKKLQSQTIRKN